MGEKPGVVDPGSEADGLVIGEDNTDTLDGISSPE
jgi:hypothetical protein